MGLFGPRSLEERIMQIIEKQEKVLQKWPCMLGEDDYYILWDMYLGGITEYMDPKFLYMIEPMENKINHGHMADLLRNACRPEAIEQALKKGKGRDCRNQEYFLAALAQTQEERDAIIRKYMFTNTAVACHLMFTDKVDTYCRTADEKAAFYMKVINTNSGYTKSPGSFCGRRYWEWETFYGKEPVSHWIAIARYDLKDMLKQGSEAKAAAKKQLEVLERLDAARKQQSEEARALLNAIDLFVQNELEIQLVDRDGKRVRKEKDGTVVPMD